MSDKMHVMHVSEKGVKILSVAKELENHGSDVLQILEEELINMKAIEGIASLKIPQTTRGMKEALDKLAKDISDKKKYIKKSSSRKDDKTDERRKV